MVCVGCEGVVGVIWSVFDVDWIVFRVGIGFESVGRC